MTSLLFFAAAASVCLAAAVWLVLIAARALRVALARRSRGGRERAATAFARFETDRDVEALAAGIAPIRLDALCATLARRLGRLQPEVRAGVGEALERVRFGKRVRRRYRRAPEGTRLLHCELLCEVPVPGAVSFLQQALADRSPLVRMGAAISLAALGAAPATRTLLGRLGREACASARLAFLFERLLPEREEEIASVAGDGALPARIRIGALQSLALARPDRYRRLLPELAGDRSPAVAVEVARALARADDPAAPALLDDLAAHPSRLVRREAAEAADGPARGFLLRDRDPTVASRAARALWQSSARRRTAEAEPQT